MTIAANSRPQIAVVQALRCSDCGSIDLVDSGAAVYCRGCALTFPRVHGVVNTLVHPTPAVLRELRGLMAEHHLDPSAANLDAFMIRRAERIPTQAELEVSTARDPNQYYLANRLNLEQALARIDLRAGARVLEIGGESPFPFLAPFIAAGWEAFALNIHFAYAGASLGPWPAPVLGDMNRLPFRDDYFDIVLASATTHHSPDMDRTIAEIARVLKPGGQALILNDPIAGRLKHLWDRCSRAFRQRRTVRHDLIHENEYPLSQYRRLFRRHGLRLTHSLFSAYYDLALSRGRIAGVRWAPIAAAAAACWRIPAARRWCRRRALGPGQRLLGLALNVIVEKPASGAR